jgi:hypothetical protein
MDEYTAIAGGLSLVGIGALVTLVKWFLKREKEKDAAFLGHIEKKDEQFTTFLGNHMSGNTKAMQEVAAELRSLRESK